MGSSMLSIALVLAYLGLALAMTSIGLGWYDGEAMPLTSWFMVVTDSDVWHHRKVSAAHLDAKQHANAPRANHEQIQVYMGLASFCERKTSRGDSNIKEA